MKAITIHDITFFRLTLICIAIAFVLTFSINIPVVGMVTVFLSAPLDIFFPELFKTGQDVEVWFFGMHLKTIRAWSLFIAYFYFIISIFVYPVTILVKIANRLTKKRQT